MGPSPGTSSPVAVLLPGAVAAGGLLLHGRPLAAWAADALAATGLPVLTAPVTWAELAGRGGPVLLHDPACPLVPAEVLVALSAGVVDREVVAGSRPVTDTIKRLAGSRVGATVDRNALVALASPVVLGAAVVARLAEGGWAGGGGGVVGPGPGNGADLPALVAALAGRVPVRFVEVPSVGRRVTDASEVLLLEAYEELHSP